VHSLHALMARQCTGRAALGAVPPADGARRPAGNAADRSLAAAATAGFPQALPGIRQRDGENVA